MSPRYRDFKINFWILTCAVFTMRIGQFMVLPFFAIFVTQQFHGSPVLAGTVVGMGPLFYALASFNSGHLTDKFGAKKVIIYSLGIGCIGFVLMYTLHNIASFLIVSMMLGICRSAFNAASRAYIYLVVSKQLRTLAFGVNYIAINVGFGIGLLIGTLFAAQHSVLLFLIVAVVYCLLAMTLFFVLPNIIINQDNSRVTFAATVKILVKDTKLLFLVFALILVWICYAQLDSVLPIEIVHTMQNGTITFAKIIAVNAVLASFCQPFISKIMSKVAFMKQTVLAMLLLIAGYICYIEFNGVLAMMIGMAILTLGELIFLPLVDVWIGSLANQQQAGAYYAAGNFFMLGNALGPILGGIVYEQYGFKMVYIFCVIITLLAIPFFNKALPFSNAKP